jgi:hypothetical protein
MVVKCLDCICVSTLLYARFEILLTVLKIQDFCDLARFRLVIVTDVSQNLPASIFRLLLDRLDPEDGDNKILSNIGNCVLSEMIILPKYLDLRTSSSVGQLC